MQHFDKRSEYYKLCISSLRFFKISKKIPKSFPKLLIYSENECLMLHWEERLQKIFHILYMGAFKYSDNLKITYLETMIIWLSITKQYLSYLYLIQRLQSSWKYYFSTLGQQFFLKQKFELFLINLKTKINYFQAWIKFKGFYDIEPLFLYTFTNQFIVLLKCQALYKPFCIEKSRSLNYS